VWNVRSSAVCRVTPSPQPTSARSYKSDVIEVNGFELDTYQRYDDNNFPLTASLKSQFLRFVVKEGQILNLIFLTRKRLDLAQNDVWHIVHGCVQRCDLMWPWRRKQKRTETLNASNWLFAQTTHVDVVPPKILHAGSCSGGSYILQISWEAVDSSLSCGGRKSPSPIDLAHRLLPHKPWFRKPHLWYARWVIWWFIV